MAVIACELWSLIDNVCIRDYDVAWRKAVRCAVKFPPDIQSFSAIVDQCIIVLR